MLIGLQLSVILDSLSGRPTGVLTAQALMIAGVVIVTRLAGVYPAAWLPRLSARVRVRDPVPPPSHTFLVGWMGMRGAVTLAAALALPLHTDSGAAFPGRDLIVFFAFSVILVTLLGQGLPLPWLIRRLGLQNSSEGADWREAEARLRAAEAALERIEELAGEDWVRPDTAERMRGLYDYRRRRFSARVQGSEDETQYEERSASFQRFRRELLEAERAMIVDLRRKGVITEDVMRRVERDLDLEHSRLEV